MTERKKKEKWLPYPCWLTAKESRDGLGKPPTEGVLVWRLLLGMSGSRERE